MIYCLGMHVCDKTIEKSKEILITEDRKKVTSEKEGMSCVQEGQQGGFWGAGNVPFLDLVGHRKVYFIITHYTE